MWSLVIVVGYIVRRLIILELVLTPDIFWFWFFSGFRYLFLFYRILIYHNHIWKLTHCCDIVFLLFIFSIVFSLLVLEWEPQNMFIKSICPNFVSMFVSVYMLNIQLCYLTIILVFLFTDIAVKWFGTRFRHKLS